MKESFIDLKIINLYGWEQYKSDKVVQKIMEFILDGNKTPAVEIEMENETNFQISKEKINNGKIDGGHHRALAHFYANKKLNCIIIKRIPKLTNEIKINDIILVPDNEIVDGIYKTPRGKLVPVRSFKETQK